MYFTDYELVLDVCYSGQVPAIMAELVCLLVCIMYNYGGGFSNCVFSTAVLPDPSGISFVNACGMKYMCCVPFVI